MIAKPDTSKQPTKTEPEPQPKKKRRGYFSAALGLLLGLCGLMASRLGQLWIAFDVFAQFTLQFAFLTIAFAAAMLVPRFKVLAGLVIFVALLAAYGSWPHFVSGSGPVQAEAPAAGHKLLRVASFNTHLINDDLKAQAASIRALQADLVVLLEVGPAKRAMLDDLKSDYPYQFDCNTNPHCKMAIISKTPLSETGFRVQWEGPPYIRASLGPDFGNIAVFGVHTIRFPHSRAQITQARALVHELESVTTKIIMMGDFNATPYSRIVETVAKGAGLTRHTNLPSWPAWISLPQLAIDHIFTSPEITAASHQIVGDAGGSDHLPVSIVLSVPVK